MPIRQRGTLFGVTRVAIPVLKKAMATRAEGLLDHIALIPSGCSGFVIPELITHKVTPGTPSAWHSLRQPETGDVEIADEKPQIHGLCTSIPSFLDTQAATTCSLSIRGAGKINTSPSDQRSSGALFWLTRTTAFTGRHRKTENLQGKPSAFK
ncbi:hypothetical protein EYF80_020982 [Liparis tanakae]|uniref:Uncharacterized protein n=1 Tax=Liparis tanakae TaxID=230148 RepID=A0A4Z2HUV0_9TELE|nr:hypothetical protein EYF80_020982 [Liparis tanakae]